VDGFRNNSYKGYYSVADAQRALEHAIINNTIGRCKEVKTYAGPVQSVPAPPASAPTPQLSASASSSPFLLPSPATRTSCTHQAIPVSLQDMTAVSWGDDPETYHYVVVRGTSPGVYLGR
jgi:hypothetical protein